MGSTSSSLHHHIQAAFILITKKTFSVVLLAVVDAEYHFCLVHIGEYGRSSDEGVFVWLLGRH